VDAVLRDHLTAPISDKEKALFTFMEATNRASQEITRDDVDLVRAAGWSDEAIYDAVTVCALFNFYNVWVDATGVSDMPEAAYLAGGERMASRGYLPGPEG
jgi:alkylhydroperoxidase family enzyme